MNYDTERDERIIPLDEEKRPIDEKLQPTGMELSALAPACDKDRSSISDEPSEAKPMQTESSTAKQNESATPYKPRRENRAAASAWQPVSKAKDRQRRRKGSAASNEMISHAAAALAGVFAMMILLLSTQLPKNTLNLIMGLTEPIYDITVVAQAAPSDNVSIPKETPQATDISIRLADVDTDVGQDILIQLMGVTAELINSMGSIDLSGNEPKVLIYHTHDTEAYTQTEQYAYIPSGQWRTYDNTRNVIAVGEELARILREDYGIAAIHDVTSHEPPKLTEAYNRSCATMEYYKQKYPSLEMYIDLHRDAYSVSGVNTDYAVIDGEQVARMMFVVGTGEGATGSGTDPMPDFESNYALAMNLTETLLTYSPKLARNVRVKSGRYNQHISSKCILVEVGHNANTLEEALAAMPYLAKAIAEVAGINPSSQPLALTP